MSRFIYKGRSYNNLRLASLLLKEYNACPDCGNNKIGGEPSYGSMEFDGDNGTFKRGCNLCGWSVFVQCNKETAE